VSKGHIRWKKSPEARDLQAAGQYLLLLEPPAAAAALVRALRGVSNSEHAAKDLLRASGLPLLTREESHVAQDLKRIRKGRALGPVLLVQGDGAHAVPLTVADGYHRICAAWYHDEDAAIACRLARRSG
jgi:hypothetical protein